MRAASIPLILLIGCAEAPVEVPFGGLTMRVESEPPRVVVRSGARTLIDADRFAFREADATWEIFYGSFRITETEEAWAPVSRFYDLTPEEDGRGVGFRFDGGFGFVRVVADGVARINLASDGDTRTRLAARCEAGEHFLGLGAHTDAVDHRGHTVPLWTSEQGIGKVDSDDPPGDWFFRGTRHSTYFPVPFFLDSRGFGVELETSHRSVFDFCNEDAARWRVDSGEGALSLAIYDGPAPLDVIDRRAQRTGKAPLPPPFVFAPWNDAVFGSAEVRRVADVLRRNNIPSSAIWTEDWAGGEGTPDAYALKYGWEVDRALYPDVEALATELHAAGFKWLGYFNSFVESDAAHYQEGADKGYLIKKNNAPYLFEGVRFKPASLVDLTNPAAVDWMAAFMDRAISVGFDGWMADFGEWLPPDAELHQGDAEAVHNEYPVLFQKLNEKVFAARANDGVDRISFVRSGYRGSQAIAHQVAWGGDQTTDFRSDDGMPTVIPIGIGLGVVGMPYYGHDVGGYFTRPGGNNTGKELFFRWTTLGALSPILRTHHGTEPAQQWRFDSDAETLAHWKRWATLHQQLYPYLRAAAEDGAARAAPMMRSLGLAFPDDDRAWSIADEFMLGGAILVAPIVAEGLVDRSVYLPEGTWLPLLGGMPLDGGRDAQVLAALTEIPAFVRAGSVLILLPSSVQSLATTIGTDEREVWIYLGGNGSAADPTSALRVTSSDGAPGSTLTWNGAAVGSVDPANRTATATGDGPGTLVFGGATVTVEGAGRHSFVVRW